MYYIIWIVIIISIPLLQQFIFLRRKMNKFHTKCIPLLDAPNPVTWASKKSAVTLQGPRLPLESYLWWYSISINWFETCSRHNPLMEGQLQSLFCPSPGPSAVPLQPLDHLPEAGTQLGFHSSPPANRMWQHRYNISAFSWLDTPSASTNCIRLQQVLAFESTERCIRSSSSVNGE